MIFYLGNVAPVSNVLVSTVFMAWLVGSGSCVAAIVASLMAEEQNQRLRQGLFGAVAGSAVGGLAALLTKQESLLVIGFVGSTFGAFVGWMISLILSIWAATTDTGRTVLEYQIGGWEAVKKKIAIDNTKELISALEIWKRSYIRRITKQKEFVSSLDKSLTINNVISFTLSEWIVSYLDALDLFFHIAESKELRSRVTIIVFGVRSENVVGKHWISDSGALQQHNNQREFDNTSIGYKVLTGEYSSPYKSTIDVANSEAGQKRGSSKYRPFLTFRINSNAVLAIDWPDESSDEMYFEVTRELFQIDFVPAVEALLSHWHGEISSSVGLSPLRVD